MWGVLVRAISVGLCISVLGLFRGPFTSETPRSHREKQLFEPAAYYKKNCEECHGAAAEKKFNPDLPEGQMIDSILNGVKAEGSRDMPAYAEKGIDETKAKALISYMKSIRE